MEYKLTVNPDSNEPIILINDVIGCDETMGGGILGSDFEREILSLDDKGKKRIRVYINSVGGSVIDGMSIYNAIIHTKTPVDTYCVGIAASIAGVIFTAGKNRYIADYGLLMIHNPYRETGEIDEFLNRTEISLAKMISSRCNLPESLISDMMDKETWMNAVESIENGFATEVIKSGDSNKKRINKSDTIEDKWLIFNKILNKDLEQIKNKNKNMSLNKINAKLGLNEEAAIEFTLAEITKLQNIKNEYEEDEDGEDEDGETLDKMKMAYEEMKNKYEDCYSKLIKMEEEMKEAEIINKKEKASALVQNYIKLGKLKNEEAIIAKWSLLAEHDYATAEDLLKDLPINRSAITIETKNNPTDKKVIIGGDIKNGYDAVALKMQELRNKYSK